MIIAIHLITTFLKNPDRSKQNYAFENKFYSLFFEVQLHNHELIIPSQNLKPYHMPIITISEIIQVETANVQKSNYTTMFPNQSLIFIKRFKASERFKRWIKFYRLKRLTLKLNLIRTTTFHWIILYFIISKELIFCLFIQYLILAFHQMVKSKNCSHYFFFKIKMSFSFF